MINFEENLTIGTCLYNTPHLVEPLLKSFVYHHPEVKKFNFLTTDNSTNGEIEEILKKFNIFHLRNPGLQHSPSVDILFENIKTKHVLLVDSDILILKNLNPLFDLFEKNDLTIMGEEQTDRGGYEFLNPRISPHWCLINLENIKKHNIKFHDQKHIDETGSQGFHANVPLQKNEVGKKFLDCGTSFYGKVQKNVLKIGKINQRLVDYVYHLEGGGGSWKKQSGIKQYQDWLKESETKYFERAKQFKDVSIKDKFFYE